MSASGGGFNWSFIKWLGPTRYLQYGITMYTFRMVPSFVAEQNYYLVQITVMSANRISGEGPITL